MPQPLEFIADALPGWHLPTWRREQIARVLTMYEGGEVQVVLRRPKRTTQANRYYWKVVMGELQRAAIAAGHAVSTEELHEWFKRKYLPNRTANVLGAEITLPPTTTDLDQTAFSEYIEAIKNDEMTIQLGAYWPEPDGAFRSYRIAEPA